MRVAAFAVIGGGVDGALYVRQLQRAAAAGRLDFDAVTVVDRDPACLVARQPPDPRVRVAVADWSDWLDAELGALPAGSQLVPYHWAPHLLETWLERQAGRAGAAVSRRPLPALGLPFESVISTGERALSYATWRCPPTCVEPALCPHTRGPKDWSLAADLAGGRPVDGVAGRIVFRCLHLVWGVGTIPVAEILAGRDRVLAGLREGPRRWLVATSSHCHALAASLDVAPHP